MKSVDELHPMKLILDVNQELENELLADSQLNNVVDGWRA